MKGKAHKIFGNIINRNFNVDEPNKIWCTDFTYLPMSNGKMRYNCTIIDLYNREVIATLNSNHITARLAVDTLKIAMKRRENFRNVILHSDQGSQYTSKEFIDFCCKNNIKQSMSRAGCPYDNAVIERFYNTFKNEFFNLYSFNDYEVLDKKTYEFIYIKYNYLRPHS
ncbi:IS3 family transposase, partial [Sebaldella sp. S0638]|nr:IS3 family transposase [Sebaldella sp. S0638]